MGDSLIQILIADDHPIVRDRLNAVINDQPDMEVVAEAVNGKEAVELAQQHRPDVMLIDLRMPQMNGLEAVNTIRAEWPQARIIILTTYDGDEDIYRALQAGAQVYLLKGMPRTELLDTIRAVHAGHKRIPLFVPCMSPAIYAYAKAGNGKRMTNDESYVIIWPQYFFRNGRDRQC